MLCEKAEAVLVAVFGVGVGGNLEETAAGGCEELHERGKHLVRGRRRHLISKRESDDEVGTGQWQVILGWVWLFSISAEGRWL